jgi:high affinity Mn2+ porin
MQNTLTTMLACALLALVATSATAARADDDTVNVASATTTTATDERWNAHVQSTYIWQGKPAFSAAYSGVNSLSPQKEKSYSFSATAMLGLRLLPGTELYLDPEVVQGVALSALAGLGGMTNGEQQKTGGPNPTLYRARLFLRQTFNFGGDAVMLASDANQLASTVAARRLVLTVGNLAATDIFDASAYAHDARSQFLNWALVSHGAVDFAADARGYTWGGVAEAYMDDWVLRAGRFAQPFESNGQALDHAFARHHGDEIEVEHAHSLAGRPGKLRALVFRSTARMGSFSDALALAAAAGKVGTPDVALVRKEASKHGFGVSLEQSVSDDAGVFARASWNDGRYETYAFAEIERSLAVGATLNGTRWQRPQDSLGLALVRNGLSTSHQAYLAAGGHGAFIGDGGLQYRPETIVEGYYSVGLGQRLGAATAISFDWQHIANPAYNAARGPVQVYAVRLHAQY